VLAVVLNEDLAPIVESLTAGAEAIAPVTLEWEIGNALSAGLKRGKLTAEQAIKAVPAFRSMDIRFVDVSLERAVRLAISLNIYAYDAYMISCAQDAGCRLLTLDRGLRHAAERAGVTVVEVQP
jgi:predicted nucleic acid-binding protein